MKERPLCLLDYAWSRQGDGMCGVPSHILSVVHERPRGLDLSLDLSARGICEEGMEFLWGIASSGDPEDRILLHLVEGEKWLVRIRQEGRYFSPY